MAGLNEELMKWFEELQTVDEEYHLLCPKQSDDDGENYKTLSDPHTEISIEEKQKRIREGEARIETTYWNSLIFGYDKKDAGKWLETFTNRLEHCLKHCSDCVLNWHMKRRVHLEKFAEYVTNNQDDGMTPRQLMVVGDGMRTSSSISRSFSTNSTLRASIIT